MSAMPEMKISRLLLGLAGGLAVAALILSLASLIILGNRTESFLELQRFLGQILGG